VIHSEWDSLQRHAQNLYRAGDYGRALQIAQRALEMAEEDAGSEDPAVRNPAQTVHRFRSKSSTDSDRYRPPRAGIFRKVFS